MIGKQLVPSNHGGIAPNQFRPSTSLPSRKNPAHHSFALFHGRIEMVILTIQRCSATDIDFSRCIFGWSVLAQRSSAVLSNIYQMMRLIAPLWFVSFWIFFCWSSANINWVNMVDIPFEEKTARGLQKSWLKLFCKYTKISILVIKEKLQFFRTLIYSGFLLPMYYCWGNCLIHWFNSTHYSYSRSWRYYIG